MSEPSLKVFSRQAERYYERGVAAARGGQRTVAAGLLRQAVRLNPQHEQAWLWLSGVLDDPADIAFSLRAALSINPHNERARRGLEHILAQQAEVDEQQEDEEEERRPARSTFEPPAAEPVPWWMSWRDAYGVWRWTMRLLWSVPILLILITVGVRTMLIVQPLPKLVTYRDFTAPPTAIPPTPQPSSTPVPGPTTDTSAQQAISSYFTAVRDEQERLRQAVAAYRESTSRTRTTVERTAATRTLYEEVEASRRTLGALQPPPGAEQAHATYLEGLAAESQALQELLTFYSDYNLAAANRAALRLQDARTKIDEGKAAWDAFAQQAPPAIAPDAATP